MGQYSCNYIQLSTHGPRAISRQTGHFSAAAMLSHYLAFAIRNLRRAPFASAVSVLTLAIGLVCFLAAHALVTFFERADGHFVNADRIQIVTTSFTFFGGQFTRDRSTRSPEHLASLLQADFPEIEAIARAFEIDWQGRTAVASGDRVVQLYSVAADPTFLDIFNLPFLAGDPRNALAAPRSVVLTRDSARQLFGDTDPIGQPLRIRNRVDTTVTGVIDEFPDSSHIGRSAAATLRLELLASVDVIEAIEAERLASIASDLGIRAEWPAGAPRQVTWTGEDAVTYLLLPADGSASVGNLADQLPAFVARHAPSELLASTNLRYELMPIGELLRRGVDTELFSGDIGVSVSTVLLLLGSLVLAVACINFANLAAARAAGRTREVGLRKALGARPAQIMVQHLLEAALLSFAALLIAVAGLRTALPLLERLAGLSPGAIGFGAAESAVTLLVVVIATTFAAGAYPAFVLARTGASLAIRRPHGPRGSKRFAELLVGAQFAVAGLLLIALTVIALQNAQLELIGLGSADASLVLIENQSDVTRVDTATLHAALGALPQVEAGHGDRRTALAETGCCDDGQPFSGSSGRNAACARARRGPRLLRGHADERAGRPGLYCGRKPRATRHRRRSRVRRCARICIARTKPSISSSITRRARAATAPTTRDASSVSSIPADSAFAAQAPPRRSTRSRPMRA
jgi:putative ABC transport system permease protein